MKLLWTERKRTERSGRRFVLMILDPGDLLKFPENRNLPKLILALSDATRDTDLTGWYKHESLLGVIFTEIGNGEDATILNSLSAKVMDRLRGSLTSSDIHDIKLTFHIFPEDWNSDEPDDPVKASLVMGHQAKGKKAALFIKRLIDVGGSITGLVFSLPLMLLIAAAIKITSPGPVLFRQVRVGQFGRKFTFLKFRSMYVNSDPKIHEEYVKRFIVGASGTEQTTSDQQKIYKLTTDPRITAVGRFLRSSSLDELPQFINVLRGEMSLVGPRPPVMYEYESYHLWHKQRMLAVKPGITGLWQVHGRSRMKFDDMVRLDIRYARCWSLLLDLKILLQTPRAVLSRTGAC